MPNFSRWPIAGYPSKSAHWSTQIIRQSGIQSLNTRREWLAASQKETTGVYGVQNRHGLSQAGILPNVSSEHDTALQY